MLAGTSNTISSKKIVFIIKTMPNIMTVIHDVKIKSLVTC